MLIPIQAEDGDSVRWSILELQGTVTARDEGPVAGLPLGRLEVKQGKPILYIGSHRAVGKFEKLSKPLTLMRPVPSASSGQEGADAGSSSDVTYKVVARVTEKCVFSGRPHPVVRRAGLSAVK